MNPALATSGCGGLAGAVVVVLNALLQHFFSIVPDPNVVVAEATIATAICGVGAHYLTRVVPPLPAPANAPAAAPATFPVAALLALFLAGSALSGCVSLGLTGNPANDLPIISADAIKAVGVACTEAQPFEVAAMLTPDPKVQVIAGTLAGGCDVATGAVTPVLAAKIDPTTEAWIRASVGMLQTLGVTPVAAPVTPAPAAAPAKT